MKKIIAIFLALITVFAFSACGGESVEKNKEDPNDHLSCVGTWKCNLPLEVALLMNGMSLNELFGDFTAEEVGCDATLNLYFEFKEDKTGALVQKGSEFDSFFLEIYRDYYSFLSDYDIATELYGMEVATLDKNAHDQYGVSTWPEAMDKAFEDIQAEAAQAPAKDSVSDIIYSVSGNILTVTYTADSTVEKFEINDNTLKCIESDNIGGDISGYNFTKVEIPETLTEEYLTGTWSEMITLEDMTALSGKTPTENFNTLLSDYGITLSDLGMVVPNNIPIKYIITFENGESTQSVQAISYFEFLDDFYNSFADYLNDPVIFAQSFIEGGYAALEELCREQDITIEEYMADELEYIRNIGKQTREDMESSFAKGKYSISENILTVSSDTDSVEYTYEAGKLTTLSDGLTLVFQKDITA